MNTLRRRLSVFKAAWFFAAMATIILLAGCNIKLPGPTSTAIPPASTPVFPSSSPAILPTDTIPTLASPSPLASPVPTYLPSIPVTVHNPPATPFTPSSVQLELMKYVLELINQDRTSDVNNLTPVELSFNAAAQKHAQDMIDNHVLAAHWGTDGLKPYMRYTIEGGINYDLENSCYVESSDKLDVKQELQLFEQTMVLDDAASNWSHLNTIMNKWNKKVNIGIAYADNAVALVQDFEGDYLEYFQPPTLIGNLLSLSGRFINVNNVFLPQIEITFDDLPQPISPAELSNNADYHHYSLGPQIGLILSPPPSGQVYKNLPVNNVVANTWNVNQSGEFWIEADIGPILTRGRGVYTLGLVAIVGVDHLNMTNYSIFVQ